MNLISHHETFYFELVIKNQVLQWQGDLVFALTYHSASHHLDLNPILAYP